MTLWTPHDHRALAPLSGLYGTAVRLRRALYDGGLLAAAAPPHTTFSVGGLEAGGSGKTPVTAWLLATLVALGRSPGLLSRGYGRTSRGLVLRRSGQVTTPAELGDEPAMLVAQGLDVPVAACGNRRRGAQALRRLCDVLVMDDGFAHRALARQLDIVVLRAEAPWGNGRLLPRGSLREPPSSLRRAHVLWLHRKTADAGLDVGDDELRRWAPGALVVRSHAVPTAPVDGHGVAVSLQGQPVVAATGIARPAPFIAGLTAAGARVVQARRFADHHRFSAADAAGLEAQRRAAQAAAVVVTPKDAIKLRTLWLHGETLWVQGSRVALDVGEAAFLARLKLMLRR